MASVSGAGTRFDFARPDGRRLALERVLLIRRLILSGQFYCPGPDVSRTCNPDPPYLCFFVEVVWAGVWRNSPLYLTHVVVGPAV